MKYLGLMSDRDMRWNYRVSNIYMRLRTIICKLYSSNRIISTENINNDSY